MQPPRPPLGAWPRTLAAVVLCALVIAGCGDDQPKTAGDKPLGAACSAGAECVTGLCVAVEGAAGLCTTACDAVSGSGCPSAANWRCEKPAELAEGVCACIADADREVCGDGLDNDCNGAIDDCLACDGALIGPGDARHCGACFRACTSGASCEGGQCRCADGSLDDACVREPGAPECATDSDCSDAIDCTSDSCVRGQCVHAVGESACGRGQVCDLMRSGCRVERACAADADCADDDPCTSDERCEPATRTCVWRPFDGDLDGHPPRVCGGDDCDDGNPQNRPGALELCDGVDNDCNHVPDAPLPELVCGPTRTCNAGSCVCNAGTTACGADCADLISSDAHCGACDRACGDGTHCESTACVDVDECALGTTECGEHGRCVNVPGGFLCQCEQGYKLVGNACVDVDECAVDLDDCVRGCSNTVGGFTCACPEGYTGDGRTCTDVDECATVTCSGHGRCLNTEGSFQCECQQGYTPDYIGGCVLRDACEAGELPDHAWCSSYYYGYQCADLLNDVANCGACGVACSSGICDQGRCACQAGSGLTYCAQVGCVDLKTSAVSCGSCGNACPNGANCVQGSCYCPAGQIACGGVCVSERSTSSCGGCGNVCASGASCSIGGSCQCPGSLPDTCSGRCVDRQTDEAHCGTCGVVCATGATCESGSCRCPTGQSVCGGTCVTTSADPANCGSCGGTCAVACSASQCVTATQVELGLDVSCALMSDGTVRCWGNAASMGIGSIYSGTVATPTQVPSLSGVTRLSVGNAHACAVTSAGALYCWGANGSYQAAPSGASTALPVLVGTGYTQVAAGGDFTCATTSDGRVVCWGASYLGQHGDGSTSTSYSAITGPAPNVLSNVDQLVAGSSGACARKAGKVYCWGLDISGSAQANVSEVPGLSSVTDLAHGTFHACAVQAGAVYCWGYNGEGQLGDGSFVNRAAPGVVQGLAGAQRVYTGASHTCAKLGNGSVVCWGSNLNGQFGNGTVTSSPVANAEVSGGASFGTLALGSSTSCGLTSVGAVWCWGFLLNANSYYGQNVLTPRSITW